MLGRNAANPQAVVAAIHFGDSRRMLSRVFTSSALHVPSARVVGVFQDAVVEVQAESHRCTMLRSVPATKQNDPIRYSQLLMLPLDVWRIPEQGLGSRS